MRVDGRDIEVTGNLLQPLTRRINDILRLVLAAAFLVAVIASSLVTRYEWVALERSVSRIVGVLSPKVSNLVYLGYGIAILGLPFAILIGLMISRQWKMLGAYAVAGVLAVLALSVRSTGMAAPRWHFDLSERLATTLAQFLDDPRWIAMLAAMLTVSGPWLPARARRWWWTLLLAFVPIHLVVSAIVPARSLLGLAVGWFVGALVILMVGTPALEVPLDDAIRTLGRRGCEVTSLRVVRPAGRGPLIMTATGDEPAVIELYGPNQRSRSTLRQLWHKLRLRDTETAPLHASMRRAVEHRGLMATAVRSIGMASTNTIAVSALDRGWTLYAHTPPRGVPIIDCVETTPAVQLWESLAELHNHQISHGDLRRDRITVENGGVRFEGFGNAEYGATDAQLQSDVAQLLVTSASLYGPHQAVAAAITVFGSEPVLAASRRLNKVALPARFRRSLPDPGTLIAATREEVKHQTGADQIQAATITRFTRAQLIQLVLLIALVYVAYPFISAVPTFFTQVRTANWWWALLGLVVSSLTYVGAAGALWACANGLVSFKNLSIMQVANTFAATTTPAGIGGLALSTRFLQKGGLTTMRATAAVALQQSVQVIVHVILLIIFTTAAGVSADLSHFVPDAAVFYLVAGLALGIIGTFLLVPQLRRWLATAVRPRLEEVTADLVDLAREPKRFSLIVLGAMGTTLGAALALWASVEAFGGTTSFVTVCVVTMVGGTLASAAPTPGGVGAVEAALIGGLAAFGLPAAIGVPSVLLYRVLTCWLPVFIGWPVMGWLTRNEMI